MEAADSENDLDNFSNLNIKESSEITEIVDTMRSEDLENFITSATAIKESDVVGVDKEI